MRGVTAATRVIWLATAAAAATLGVVALSAQSPRPGASSDPVARSTAIVPFQIRVSGEVLSDLKQRLTRARFADEIPGAEWDYGTNLAYLKTLVAYWRDRYDWRAQERRLNEFEQFKTSIDGLDIHFIHRRSKTPGAAPLLLLNGWPSSIEEYAKVIGPLTDPAAHGGQAADAFHVVIPSMPGYGFSDKPRERGYNPERMADVWVKLMARLGYARYITHGSDWGIAVATHLALKDSAHMSALHLAGCPGGTPPAAPAPPTSTPPPVSSNLGYQEIQTTKPQTLGHGLSDSPIGLASWIIDKWQSWSDHDGDLEKVYTKDELLTNIMIYWVTNSGTSSARLYYESRHVDGRLLPTFFEGFLPRLPQGRVTVPTGCGAFPSQYDRRGTPPNLDTAAARRSAEGRYNVVHLTISPRGGHFPALEQPQAWIDDLRVFARQHGR
jgi:pimeloyl-ACP methyl ester carboxylesterase